MELDPDDWGRLHELRLRGFVTAGEAAQEWARLIELGLVAHMNGRVMLTHPGRDAHERWAAAPPGSHAATVAEEAYAAFVPMNRRLLRVCHDWQIARGGVPNDHSDPEYDFKVIDRLHAINASVAKLLVDLVPAVSRFAGYQDRFDHALVEVDRGQRQWFASPLCDSFHTVWMQLHEDLLLASGRSRRDEEDPGVE